MPANLAEGPLRLAKLVRVSTRHVEQADSPRHQLAHVEAEIAREGWHDTGLVYSAELTGAVIMDRPEIQRMLQDARAGRFDAVILKSVARLGRDTLGLLMVKRMLDDLGVELIAPQDGYRSLRDPELIFLFHADRAQAGRQEISRNVKAGSVQAARRGIWPAGTLPFGLRKEGRFTIGPHPRTGPYVQLIFELRRCHWGLAKICSHLNNDLHVQAPEWWHLQDRIERLRATEGAAQDERIQARLHTLTERQLSRRFIWYPRTLRIILHNCAYRGELQYNRTTGERRLHGKLVRKPRGAAEWVTVPCTPLISRDEWEQAQGAEQTRARLPRKSLGSPFLLSGMIVCGQCGGAVYGSPARRNTGARGGDRKGYYLCRGSVESGAHPTQYFRATGLENAVLACLRAELAGLSAPAPRLPRAHPPPDPLVEMAALAAQGSDLAEALFFRREELRKGHMSQAEFDFELELIRRKEEEVQRRAEGISQGRVEAEEQAVRAVREAAQRLMRLEGSPEAVQALLRTLVRKVVVQSAEQVEVHTTFAATEVHGVAAGQAKDDQPHNRRHETCERHVPP